MAVVFKAILAKDLPAIIRNGGVGVIPTDTIYGLVGKALDKKVVERIYKIKGRKPDKPLIILVSSLKDLELFNIDLDHKIKKLLSKYWPGKVSIILPCPKKELTYLHRGTNTLAFRFPGFPELTNLIKQTGPLVAPSANPEGLKPASGVTDARNYFGNEVDFYVEGGSLKSEPSTLIAINKNTVEILRQGAVRIVTKLKNCKFTHDNVVKTCKKL